LKNISLEQRIYDLYDTTYKYFFKKSKYFICPAFVAAGAATNNSVSLYKQVAPTGQITFPYMLQQTTQSLLQTVLPLRDRLHFHTFTFKIRNTIFLCAAGAATNNSVSLYKQVAPTGQIAFPYMLQQTT
jgi:hypothetical protein